MLPLTKSAHARDLDALVHELAIIDAGSLSGQTPEARRWEYAMALRALGTLPYPELVYDVGGAGSPFHTFVDADVVTVIDPGAATGTLEAFAQTRPPCADAVCCLSVIEHVDDLSPFLAQLAQLVAPNGLLFLTADCWDGEGSDTAHFHWMRQRIFTMLQWELVASAVRSYGFRLLGDADWRYHGATLYGSYSVVSLAMVKA